MLVWNFCPPSGGEKRSCGLSLGAKPKPVGLRCSGALRVSAVVCGFPSSCLAQSERRDDPPCERGHAPMTSGRCRWGLAGVCTAALLVGCGNTRGPGETASTSSMPHASSRGAPQGLELTRRDPPRYHKACLRLRAAVGADLCPSLVPSGALHVSFALPLRGWPRAFGIDLQSPVLSELRGRRISAARGHWTIEATGSQRSFKLFNLQTEPNSADRPSKCATERIAARAVRVCRIPEHSQGGGYYGDHVTAEWRKARSGCNSALMATRTVPVYSLSWPL